MIAGDRHSHPSPHFAQGPLLSGRVQFVNTRIRGNLRDNAPWNGQNCPLFHCHKAQIAADISKSFQLGENHEKFINSCRYHELGNLSQWQRLSFDSLWKRKLSIFCPHLAAISDLLVCRPDYHSVRISQNSLHTWEGIQRNGQNGHISNLTLCSMHCALFTVQCALHCTVLH